MLDRIAASLGFVSLAVVLAAPLLFSPDDAGDNLTRFTIRLALVYYGAALTMMLLTSKLDLRSSTFEDRSSKVEASMGRLGRVSRWLWTWAWLSYVIHVVCAFHFFHHWSHADAVRHTAEVSGFGPGIYASYFFTLIWGIDVAAWWSLPRWYARRASWIDCMLHAFMLFMVFNATVVFETGLIRWAGVALFAELAAAYLYRRRLSRTMPEAIIS
jgi:hypothetical protein